MNILLIEPFFGVSHKNWALELKQYSTHNITIISLEGRHWKWRMHGGAVELANQFMALNKSFDLIIATDMLDLTTFLSLTREKTATIPTVLYFHENQLTYPWSETDQDIALNRDVHYGFINYTSALTADQCWFNSRYNMESFINATKIMLSRFPDYKGLNTVTTIKEKSHLMPLGINLSYFDHYLLEQTNPVPVILWNHRWEYDKNPEVFFHILFDLKNMNINFKLIVLGESFKKYPKVFDLAKERLKENIIHFGYAPSKEEYARLINMADILPVTSYQEFFGISIMEAAYCRVLPILPTRLTYPDLFDIDNNAELFYSTNEALKEQIIHYLNNPHLLEKGKKKAHAIAKSYDWRQVITLYNEGFSVLVNPN